MDGGDDLYGDLEESIKSVQVQDLIDKLKAAELKNTLLVTDLSELREQLQSLVMEKKQVEDNMLKLYNTAIRELERKDREILESRKENERLKRKEDKH